MPSGTLQPGETVKFDHCERCGKVNPADVHTCSPQVRFEDDFYGPGAITQEEMDSIRKDQQTFNEALDKKVRLQFGQDTIASLKEKKRQEKAAKKKLPKNFKPQDH